MSVLAAAWHLGPLHPIEQALTMLLAFGPFLVLAAVVFWRRRKLDEEVEQTGGVSPDVPLEELEEEPGDQPEGQSGDQRDR